MSETRLIVNEDGIVTGVKTTGLEVLKSSDGGMAFFADTIEVDGEKVTSEKSMFDDMSEAELKEFYAEVAVSAKKIKKYTEEQIAKAPKGTGVTVIPIHINASDFVE